MWLTFSMEMVHTCILTQDRKPTTDQSTDITKVRHGEPMNFVGIVCRNMGKGLFIGAEITQIPCGNSSQIWEPGAYCTVWDSSVDWRVPFLSASVGLDLFQLCGLISTSSRWLFWSPNLPCSFSEGDSHQICCLLCAGSVLSASASVSSHEF